MSAPAASGRLAAAAGEAGGQARGGGWQGIMKSLAMVVGMQMVMKYGMQYMGIGSKPAPPAVPEAATTVAGSAPASAGPQPPLLVEPLWPLGTPLSMLLYTSTSPSAADLDLDHPLIVWDGLTYGNWNDARAEDLLIDIPASVRAENGSLWMDILLVKDGGSSPVGKAPGEVVGYRKQLTRFLPKRRVRKEKRLMGGPANATEEDTPEDTGPTPIVAHWSANLTLTIVSSGGQQNMNGLAPHVKPAYSLAQLTPESNKTYYPPVFSNDFWLLRENMLPINSTDAKLPIHITYAPISAFKHNIFAAMTKSFEDQAAAQGTGAEIDEVKRMLTETSPWLLITTLVVTLLHSLFEFLAFASDVSHWRKKDKDLVGVSLRTILTNCFVQLVILLYLQDSSEETSFMVLFGQGIGLLIEAWKITKVVDIKVTKQTQGLIPYKITFEDKKELSEDEKKTQEYDKLAFRLVSYAAIPLLAGYTVYSLLYQTHRGWYSFIVTTLAQAIYMFGFVQLVPQLIINYKLKSVAHMPMKAMIYKTLGTVVDDFFAFCIKMPWLHRLACFRDDVVFVILLYQRWIYRIDYSRVNEFGQVNEGMVEPVGDEKKNQ